MRSSWDIIEDFALIGIALVRKCIFWDTLLSVFLTLLTPAHQPRTDSATIYIGPVGQYSAKASLLVSLHSHNYMTFFLLRVIK